MPLEPWLRGPLPGADPLLAPVLRSLQHAREDLDRWTAGLDDAALWARPHGLAPLGFQLRHIAGSVDRLMTYALGRDLGEAQLAETRREMEPGESLEGLMRGLDASLAAADSAVRALDPAALGEPRFIGRRRIPVTLGGLLLHIAEHTQRHVGQAIVTARILGARPPATM